MSAKGYLSIRFTCVQTLLRLEPLAIAINQADQASLDTEQAFPHARDAVIALFRGRIENS